MGILLSKSEGDINGTDGITEQTMELHQAMGKRKRRTATREGSPPRKSRRRGTIISRHFDRLTETTDEDGLTGNISNESAFDKAPPKEFPAAEKFKPAKKRDSRLRSSRKSGAEDNRNGLRQDDGANPISEAHDETSISRNGTTPTLQANPTNILNSPSPHSAPKYRRKRKAPTSPYFEISIPQLSSPPPTPTPPTRGTNTSPRKSKLSIIEAPGVLPSLPHFRPTSENEFGLIQEKLRHEPWKMLVAVIFLNVTTAKMALPLLAQLLERWPTPEALSQGTLLGRIWHLRVADFEELSAFLYPIGLYNTRARRLIDFSTMWLSQPPRHDVLTVRKGLVKYPPTAISHLPGVIPIYCVC